MAEIHQIHTRQEAAPLEDGADMAFHLSSFPSRQEVETQKYEEAIKRAFRTVQHTRTENHEELDPRHPLESARVSSSLIVLNRKKFMEGTLTGEVSSNVAWLDDARKRNENKADQVGNNMVSLDDYRDRHSSASRRSAA